MKNADTNHNWCENLIYDKGDIFKSAYTMDCTSEKKSWNAT